MSSQIVGFFVVLIAFLPSYADGALCAIYEQELNKHGKLDVYSIPDRIGEAFCDVCTAQKHGTKLKFDCISVNDSDEKKDFRFCLNNANKCSRGKCCCRGVDCFDKLRKHWAPKRWKRSSDTKCKVTTRYLKNELLSYPIAFNGESTDNRTQRNYTGNEIILLANQPKRHNSRPVLLSSSQRKHLDSQSNERTVLRTTCAICMANYQKDEMSTDCVEYGEIDEKCAHLKSYVGGELACDRSGRTCCCKGKNCDIQFLNKFIGQALPKATLTSPYSRADRSEYSILSLFTCLLLLFITY